MTNSISGKAWEVKTPLDSRSLFERLGDHRDISTDKDLQFYSPWLLKDMDKAVERIKKAIDAEERIMVFGDYDVDGVTGSSILYLGMKDLGAKVSVRLPHREKDGYGLNTKVLDECKKLGVSLVITTDCGISNVKEVAYGNEQGLEIIITDHHSIPPEIPAAYCILNPHQEGCEYPEKHICGAVVAFKLLQALQEKLGTSDQTTSNQYLDMAALATVADCMPLRGENRLIVKKGLLQFEQTQHRGLRTLMDSYDLKGKPLNSYHLGFNIAPCINAAGRLEDPLIAFKMMIGDTEKALELRGINEERQLIVLSALEEATALVEEKYIDDPILIFWAEDWPPGIVGLLAGRLTERFHKPSICLTHHEDKYVGSCRSIPEINIVEALQRHEDLFMNYGGHAQAAGLSIKGDKLEELRKRLIKDIGAWVKENPITPKIYVDTEITADEVTLNSIHELSQLEPFGMGNPKPKLLLKNLKVNETRVVGKEQNHLQVFLNDGKRQHKAIAFNIAEHSEEILKMKTIDVVCQLNKNEFRGNTSADMIIQDIKPSSYE